LIFVKIFLEFWKYFDFNFFKFSRVGGGGGGRMDTAKLKIAAKNKDPKPVISNFLPGSQRISFYL